MFTLQPGLFNLKTTLKDLTYEKIALLFGCFHFFLEFQQCHSSAEGFGFHQNYHTIELQACLYICQFFLFLFIKKQICICIKGLG